MKGIRVIGGCRFRFMAVKDGEDVAVSCRPADKRLLPLCAAVDTCWRYGPAKFLRAVLARHGQAYEGVAAFAYQHDYPEELAPGVTCDYLDRRVTLDEAFFRRFSAAYAEFYLAARQRHGPDRGQPEDELPRLLAVLRADMGGGRRETEEGKDSAGSRLPPEPGVFVRRAIRRAGCRALLFSLACAAGLAAVAFGAGALLSPLLKRLPIGDASSWKVLGLVGPGLFCLFFAYCWYRFAKAAAEEDDWGG